MNVLKRIANGFLNALYPHNLRCAVCGEELDANDKPLAVATENTAANTTANAVADGVAESVAQASTQPSANNGAQQPAENTVAISTANAVADGVAESVAQASTQPSANNGAQQSVENTAANTTANAEADSWAMPMLEGVCPVCLAKLRPLPQEICPKCASALVDGLCPDCGGKGFAFRGLKAVYVYDTSIKSMILGYKENGETWRKEIFAALLSQMIQSSGVGYTAIVYPPSGKRAKRRRGFDHMRLVAKRVSELTGIPILECLIKHEISEKHARLTRAEREVAAETEYEVVANFDGGTIAVLDDVATSCATLHTVCKSLQIAARQNKVVADAYVVARSILK